MGCRAESGTSRPPWRRMRRASRPSRILRGDASRAGETPVDPRPPACRTEGSPAARRGGSVRPGRSRRRFCGYGGAADLTNPAIRGGRMSQAGLGIPHRAEPPCSGSADEAKPSTTSRSTARGRSWGPAAGPLRRGRDPGRTPPLGVHQPAMGADDPASGRAGRGRAAALGSGGLVIDASDSRQARTAVMNPSADSRPGPGPPTRRRSK
jgi:hypothetical protein